MGRTKKNDDITPIGEDEASSTNGSEEFQSWLTELEYARKREEDWRKEAKRVTAIYEAEEKDEFQFNILYSNTETLAPALYNQLPSADVQRRFRDPDPLALIGCKVSERVLDFLMDSNDEDFASFDDLVRQAVLEALVPGRGLIRLKYAADISLVVKPKTAQLTPQPEEGQEPQGQDADPTDDPQATEKVVYETIVGEEVPWDRFLHGYAKTWSRVPWCSIEHFMPRDELIQNFGEEVGKKIPLTIEPSSNEDDEASKDGGAVANAQGAKLGHVYEIWDKVKRRVIFLAPAYKEGFVKEVEDPLKLHGFYPWPRPMTFVMKIKDMCPRPLYAFYEEQAQELNTCTTRINKTLRALKVRGFYDGTLDGLDKLFDAADNTLIPAENVSAMQQGQTLEKAIWLMPLDKLISVLQQLFLARTQIKQTIYEITGISDILRGQGAASETATAQNIKNQWGTLRLQRLQKEVQRYVRDCLRIMAEIAFAKFSIETLSKMTGLDYPTNDQKAQAQAQLQQLQQMGQQIQAQQPPPAPQQPGQPPAPPPPPDPRLQQIQQQMGPLQQTLAKPSWEDILTLMRSDLYRRFRVDIETNSTVTAEATEDKQNVGEFMQALTQFMHAIMPAVQEGFLPFDAAKAMLLSMSRLYRFGTEVEDELEAMQQPPPKPDPEAGKGKLELQKVQAEVQASQAKAQAEIQVTQAETQMKQQELQMQKQKMVMELEMQAKKHELEMQKMLMQGKLATEQHRLKMEQLLAPVAKPVGGA